MLGHLCPHGSGDANGLDRPAQPALRYSRHARSKTTHLSAPLPGAFVRVKPGGGCG